jgi:signal transduction histidine kinase
MRTSRSPKNRFERRHRPQAARRSDRDLLFDAVANLVDDAIKFTPSGDKVDLELLRGDGETIVRVTDPGLGIREQKREAVRRRLYRSDKMRNTPGVGLGLSLVAAIAKLHGFRLIVSPGPGAGSTSCVRIRWQVGWALGRACQPLLRSSSA